MSRLKKLEFCDEATKKAAAIAFGAGWQAYMDGIYLTANPYKSGTWDDLEQRKHNQWRFGWGEAKGIKRLRDVIAAREELKVDSIMSPSRSTPRSIKIASAEIRKKAKERLDYFLTNRSQRRD